MERRMPHCLSRTSFRWSSLWKIKELATSARSHFQVHRSYSVRKTTSRICRSVSGSSLLKDG